MMNSHAVAEQRAPAPPNPPSSLQKAPSRRGAGEEEWAALLRLGYAVRDGKSQNKPFKTSGKMEKR